MTAELRELEWLEPIAHRLEEIRAALGDGLVDTDGEGLINLLAGVVYSGEETIDPPPITTLLVRLVRAVESIAGCPRAGRVEGHRRCIACGQWTRTEYATCDHCGFHSSRAGVKETDQGKQLADALSEMAARGAILDTIATAAKSGSWLGAVDRIKELEGSVANARRELSAIIAERDAVACELREGAMSQAFDAIAKLVGSGDWEYPGQVVRDVEAALGPGRLAGRTDAEMAALRERIKFLEKCSAETGAAYVARLQEIADLKCELANGPYFRQELDRLARRFAYLERDVRAVQAGEPTPPRIAPIEEDPSPTYGDPQSPPAAKVFGSEDK